MSILIVTNKQERKDRTKRGLEGEREGRTQYIQGIAKYEGKLIFNSHAFLTSIIK